MTQAEIAKLAAADGYDLLVAASDASVACLIVITLGA